jgi:hypothetical protein
MTRITPRVFQALSVVALLLSAATSHPSFTQTPAAPADQTPATAPAQRQLLSVTMVSVKPEAITEFQNLMKNETNPALRKGGLKWRNVWQTTIAAGNPFEYVIVAPIDSFAQYDGAGPLEKALGKDGFAAWQAKANRLITGVHRYIIRTRPDLSLQGKMTGPPKMAVVTSLSIAPGHNQDYENYLKNDFLPVIKQSQGAVYLVSETLFGGDGNEYVTLTLRDSFADLDKGPITIQVLGEEGARKLVQKMPAGTVTHIERSLVQFVPELSIMPTEAANK